MVNSKLLSRSTLATIFRDDFFSHKLLSIVKKKYFIFIESSSFQGD